MIDESLIRNAGEEAMVRLAVVIALLLLASPAYAADDDIVGTYRLISANRVILATGDSEDSYGKNPIGFMTYGRDGRMMGMIVFSNRPKAESLDKMTDQQRADLFRTMIAYGGTYTFRGNSVEHHIDISWNELWTGTTGDQRHQERERQARLYDKAGPISPRRKDEHQYTRMGKGEIASPNSTSRILPLRAIRDRLSQRQVLAWSAMPR